MTIYKLYANGNISNDTDINENRITKECIEIFPCNNLNKEVPHDTGNN